MELVIIKNRNKQHRVTFGIDQTRLKIAQGTSAEDVHILVKHTRILQGKLKITRTLRGDPHVIRGHFVVSLHTKTRNIKTTVANYSSIKGLTAVWQAIRHWWTL